MERSVKIGETGGPEVMQWVEADLALPAPGEIRVRHHTVAVNIIDLQQRAGRFPLALPSGLGLEAAGIVEAVGEGEQALKVGDRVVYVARVPGCYATARNVASASAFVIPAGIGFDQAAAIFSRGLLAWHLTRTVHPVGVDDHVVVYAASGVVGSLIAQFASRAGAHVTGLVKDGKFVNRAKDAGCHAVLMEDDVAIAEHVRHLSGGRGATVVYDSVGQKTFRSSLECLRPHGLLVAFGNSSGKIPPISIMDEFGARGSLQLAWCMLKDFLTPDLMPEAVQGLFDALLSASVRIEVGQRFEFDEVQEAHRVIEADKAVGATILCN